MNILFYRYKSIYEPDMIDAFNEAGLNVIEINNTDITSTSNPRDHLSLIDVLIKKYAPLFIYGVNFFPVIAELCRIYNILYLCQTVDSPVLTLFSNTIKYPTTRIFMFDREQYKFFHPYNPQCIHHLPLASATKRFDKVTSGITNSDKSKYAYDISFVGSTYREKDPLSNMIKLSDYTKGYINALINVSLKLYGYYPVKDAIDQKIIDDFKISAGKEFPTADNIVAPSDSYVISHEYIASHLAVIEREQTLNALAKYFNVRLYTNSDTSSLYNIDLHKGISTLEEMPKVFNLSKINLNITLRSIESGLPLRCFDILGCGGFLMTNYQSEIDDMFVIGRDLETYSSIDELIDKCEYYLSHEDERQQIALNGYNTVKNRYTHIHRLNHMLKLTL